MNKYTVYKFGFWNITDEPMIYKAYLKTEHSDENRILACLWSL